MSNLVKRTISSIVFVALILGPLFLTERIAYSVYSLLGFFTLSELLNLTQKTGSSPLKVLGFTTYGILVALVYQWIFHESEHSHLLLLALGAIVLVAFFIEIFRQNPKPFESISAPLTTSLFTALSFLGIAYFYVYRSDLPSPWITISVFALIWINDSAAYLVGRKIGKTKLFERLSPNKTREGSTAGLIFAMLTGYGLSFIEGMPHWVIMIAFSLVCVISGSLGDLFESRIKRAAGVKDSGVFLPGHGGFFDRFDAMMLAIPTAILFFEALLPKH